MDTETRPIHMLSTKSPLQTTYRLKVRGWKNIFHANGRQKKAGVAILISDKTDFKIKKITIDKAGHYIMFKGSIQEEDITIIYICIRHRRTSIRKTNTNKYKRRNR